MDKNTLEELYVTNEMTAKEIAEKLNVTIYKIKYHLKKYKIPTRPSGRKNNSNKIINTKIGKLFISKEIKNNRNKIAYMCICECGEFCERTYSSLHNKSCCWKCRNKEISNQNWNGFGEISMDYWSSVISSASKRKLVFNISIEYAYNIFKNQHYKCSLSGMKISLSRNKKKILSTASLDRIDSSKGYVEGNIQWVHKDVNKMKNNFNEDYFKFLCKKISEAPYATEPVITS